MTAHFNWPDPASYEGRGAKQKWLFLRVAPQRARLIDLFCAVPEGQLEPMRIRAIGGQHPLEDASPLAP